jgi:hypothetical protein
MTTPREAAEKAFHKCDGNTQQSLKAALDAYEAAVASISRKPIAERANTARAA